MRTRLLVALLVVAVLVSGCTLLQGEDPEGPGTLRPLPAVARDVPVGPADRDADRVQRALAALDPCALLSPRVTRQLGGRPDPWLRTPHTCSEVTGDVQVSTFVDSTEAERFGQQRLVLGGAVAYRSSPMLDLCEIKLPVGFDRAISFASYGRKDCAAPKAHAAAAARMLLDDPEAALRPPGKSRLRPCVLLAQALGTLPEDRELRESRGQDLSLDTCALWEIADPAETGGLPVQPVAPVLSVAFESAPVLEDFAGNGGWSREFRRVAGTRVQVEADLDSDCWVHWDAWAMERPAEYDDVIQGRVIARTCNRAVALAGDLIRGIRTTRPGTPDLTGLLYAEGEPDTAGVGVCVDVLNQTGRQCAPAVEVDVPTDPAALIARGEADPNVVCAAAAEVVRDRLDADLEPATVLTGYGGLLNPQASPVPECTFAEPTHGLRLTVRASTAPMPTNPDTLVDEHPAFIGRDTTALDDTQRHAEVALTTDEAAPGHLVIDLDVSSTRQYGPWQGAPVDQAPLAKFPDLVAALTAAMLN